MALLRLSSSWATFAPLMSVAQRGAGFALVVREPFASRTSPNFGKYERNAHKPDLPKVKQFGLVRTAYFPRHVKLTERRILI